MIDYLIFDLKKLIWINLETILTRGSVFSMTVQILFNERFIRINLVNSFSTEHLLSILGVSKLMAT